jgi:hypothetical protein
MAEASFLSERCILAGLKNVPGEMPGGTSYCLRKPPKVKSKTAAFDEVPRLTRKYRG